MAEKYEPFGEQWEKEMMQFTKKELVKLLKDAYSSRRGELQERDFTLWLRGLRGKLCLAGNTMFADCEHYNNLIANQSFNPDA